MMRYIDRKIVRWTDKKGYTAQIFLDFKEEGNNSRFVLIKMEPHTEIKPHHHTRIKEILYITKGTGNIVVNDIERRCKPEDIILVEPSEIHRMINDTDDTFEWLEFKMNDPKENDIFFEDD
ncbi:MAG: cupin domain-containing protein [archaeon]